MVAVAVLVVGLVVGAVFGRWSVGDIHVYVTADSPAQQRDPHITALDEFEGMWVLFFLVFGLFPKNTR